MLPDMAEAWLENTASSSAVSVVNVQAEDGFPREELPGGPGGRDVRKYGRNLLMFRVTGDDPPAPPADAGQPSGAQRATAPHARGESASWPKCPRP